MRGFIFCFLLAALFVACSGKDDKAPTQEHFTTEVLLKTTPVKNQRKSDLGWVYAMLSTIETERLMLGDSVHLSPEYLGRLFLDEQAMLRYVSRGKQAITAQGTGTTVLHLLDSKGVIAYDSYRVQRRTNFNILARKLMLMTDASWAHNNGMQKFQEKLTDLLDDEISPAPRFVFMYGCEYTPIQFAQSVCKKDDYRALTSFSHHPFGTAFVLETAGNHYKDKFENVPIDSLIDIMEQAVRKGHAVYWQGDTSNDNYSFKKGIARLKNEQEPVTQERRQKEFEAFRTTDDHSLSIVGIAFDQQGEKYFICKNSRGIKNPYRGFMYMSLGYARLNTIAIVVKNDD